MAGYYLKEMTVPIPENDGRVVIRRGKTVEYELDRTYSKETQDTRVTRRVIGKVDPVNPGRMFPNEMYFQLFPENEVPEEVRDEFLRGCEIKRRMSVIRRDPEEIIEGVVNGLSELRVNGRNGGDDPVYVPHSWNEKGASPCSMGGFPAQGCRPFSTEIEHTGSISGRYDPPKPPSGPAKIAA